MKTFHFETYVYNFNSDLQPTGLLGQWLQELATHKHEIVGNRELQSALNPI